MNNVFGSAAIVAILLSSTAAFAGECTNTTWKKIEERGVIVVGVKADTRPWGYRDQNGNIIGMEADLAQQVADTIGVKLELVAVESSNRMQFLEGGRIDLMIATMSDRGDRRAIVGVVGPNYYSSGTNVMTPKALGVKDWSELKGRPVCGKQGAFYNQIVEERYGAQIIAFGSNAEALQALRDKKCVAWVYDDSSIAADLASGQYDDFEMPLVSEDNNPWALAVPIGERDCVFGRFMSGMQFNWHQSGELIALEEKWGIQATAYLREQNERFADWLAD
ncbi:transporter substrate-binding domain-containing protein [Phaeovulum sp.]|uniref:transporter substrate-binding domain-containing protein n=1 Tax=Phaeovulum sp. TaxID=2934796 RepID=UPI002731C664|nr:transporter substrate-binding domain-containing protein [Phaeovulum sp.]MDP1668407.1 transporter substrate-binding domain-containing protein [Phaeovulum sp.]MDZ4120098.1 transporter substrate-binding domain-containing protein [Phaeovulum sp.]